MNSTASESVITARGLRKAYKTTVALDNASFSIPSGRIVGLIDESDILLSLFDDEESFQKKVESVMVTNLETVAPTEDISRIVDLFKQDKVAIIADRDHFYGLITRIDLINHLRQTAT